jgi:Peptidase family S41/N-terminal domain of Peptidase_S41 in eukaryotic IRBP
VERSAVARLELQINDEILTRFPAGAVRRVALLQAADDPQIDPDELLVRVFIGLPAERLAEQEAAGDMAGVPAGGPSQEESLQSWAAQHETAMRRLRRELSLRLPPARLLEFTVDDGDPGGAPRIVMPHDPDLADEPVPPREIVQTAMAILRARYVFPERAAQAADQIEARLVAGEYDELDEHELADRLTSQLYAVCADKHLRVRVHPEPMRPPPGPADRQKARLDMRAIGRLDNFGIHRVERLGGNVGYVDLRRVALPQNAGASIAAAMELVSGTYALIFDLRQNGGGSPDGVVFWCSYLFDGPGTHLNDIFEAETGETRQFWSVSYVPGTRYVDKPVYVLTSSETFSGGEDFCYTLQALGRAQLIGETTGGGAHPTGMRPLSPTMAIAVPFARSVNPITGTNWEGTGVVPDVPVAAAEAYDVAYGMALKHVLSLDPPPPIHDEATEALARLAP